MIELRTALILFGLVVFVIVVIVSYEKYRLARGRARKKFVRGDSALSEPTLTRHDELEDDNQQLPSDTQKILLAPDLSMVKEVEKGEEEAQLSIQLEAAEQIASMPIDNVPGETGEHSKVRQIDFVARVPGEKIIGRDQALGVYRQNEYLLEKPHRIFGLNHPARIWRDLEAEPETGRYTELSLTLQLSDRNGPITESELTKFSLLVLRLSESLGRRLSFSMTFEEAQKEALALDKTCKDYDVLAILNIVSKGETEFNGMEIDQALNQVGMRLGSMNIYHKRSQNKSGVRNLYSLANLYKPGVFDGSNLGKFRTKGLTLFMNIPCTPSPVQVFEEMVVTAKLVCESINGKLVDQNQNPLNNKGLESIKRQVELIASNMEGDGILPGSEVSRRLF
ncbi:cell division protein ZipA [Pseudomonadota bacterium]